MTLGLQASVLKLKSATKISIWFHHYSPPKAKYASMAQGYMTYPDSSDTVWECQAVDFRRQPQGLPTRLQLCHHLLLHWLLEVNCLDTCYPRLKGAWKAISKYARGGEELLFSPGKGEQGRRRLLLTLSCQVAQHPPWGPSGSVSLPAQLFRTCAARRPKESQAHPQITA